MKTKLFLLLIVLLFPILAGGCTRPSASPGTFVSRSQTVATGLLKGISLSPRSFEAADFTDFFEKALLTGRIVSWAGDWNELGGNSGGPKVLIELAPRYNYIPVVEIQFFIQSNGKLLRPLDEATKQSYKLSAAAFAEKYKPAYLGIGIEVNALYEKSPSDFDAFVQLFDAVYDVVKTKSPDTKVFTIFQLEKMKGLNGGLFGGVNDAAKNEWALFARFPKSDIIGFTTYPGLIYKTPAEIPANYYRDIKEHTSKPVVFTEIGWHSAASPTNWESSDAEQAEFVNRFFNLTADLNREMVIWSFMYDPNTTEPFNSMGLRRRDGTAKPGWDAWIKEK